MYLGLLNVKFNYSFFHI